MKTVKKILIGLGTCIGIMVVLFVTIIVFAAREGKGMTETLKAHLSSLRAGNFELAYSYTSDDFKTHTSLENFKKMAYSYPSLKNNGEYIFEGTKVYKDISSGLKTGTVQSILHSQDKQASNAVSYKLVMTDEGWRISSMDIRPLLYEESLGYATQYPDGWTYRKPNQYEVDFTGRNLPVRVNIRNTASVQQGGTYKDIKEYVTALKEQLKTQTSNSSVFDENDFMYKKSGFKKLNGKQFKAEYTFQGQKFKQWTIVIQRENGGIFYVWSYIARPDLFETHSSEANVMLDSWKLFQ